MQEGCVVVYSFVKFQPLHPAISKFTVSTKICPSLLLTLACVTMCLLRASCGGRHRVNLVPRHPTEQGTLSRTDLGTNEVQQSELFFDFGTWWNNYLIFFLQIWINESMQLIQELEMINGFNTTQVLSVVRRDHFICPTWRFSKPLVLTACDPFQGADHKLACDRAMDTARTSLIFQPIVRHVTGASLQSYLSRCLSQQCAIRD